MLREKTGATPGISQKTENKETETQKTNSIPFAKPIRRPMKLEGNHIAKEITSCSHYEPDNTSLWLRPIFRWFRERWQETRKNEQMRL